MALDDMVNFGVPISEVTQGTLDGEGAFDVLMNITSQHLMREWKNGRIDGAKYAEVYTQVLIAVLQQSIGFVLQRYQAKAQVDLLAQRLISEKAQTIGGIAEDTSMMGTQITLQQRQADGFLRDAEQKAAGLVSQLYATALSTDSPFADFINEAGLNKDNMYSLMGKLLTGVDIQTNSNGT